MTDARGNAEHLDDGVTSAVLDGEATPDEVAHLETCVTCTARLAALRDAALLVGAPVPPPDAARRDAAIAAALAAEPLATVTPMRRRLPPAWLGAAAAVVIAVGAIALVNRGDDRDKQTATAEADGGSAGDAATTGPEPDVSLQMEAGTSAASPAVVDGGDLGDVGSIDLAERVREALDAPPGASAAAAPTDGGAGGGSDSGTTEARDAAVACDDQARGALVFHATGSLDGAAVLVLAYDLDGERRVYVIQLDSCEIRSSAVVQ